MIVYSYGPAWGSADLSPFGVKLETWLRMAALPYEKRVGDVRKTPKRKLPVVKIGERVLGDSGLIIEHLRAAHGDPLGDAALAGPERAAAHALRAMIENELYFAAVHFRWVDEAGFRVCEPEILAYLRGRGVPRWMAPLIVGRARRGMAGQLSAQGMGRHSPAEIARIGIDGLLAVSDYLEDKPFMLGAAPHTLDATVFGFLHALLVPPVESPLKDAALARANLVAYHDRILDRWWPELSGSQRKTAA
jgi:glutathione S-transferase